MDFAGPFGGFVAIAMCVIATGMILSIALGAKTKVQPTEKKD